MASPISHKEPMSSLLPRLLDPWPFGYSPLAETLAPVDDVPPCGMSPNNPSQTSNPTILNSRFISSPPLTSLVGGQSSPQMGEVHSNTGGDPRRDLHYLSVEFLLVLGILLL